MSAILELVGYLTAVPTYEPPSTPFYEALVASASSAQRTSASSGQALTVRSIYAHRQLLHDCVDAISEQNAALSQVIFSCKQLPPTPLPMLPLGF